MTIYGSGRDELVTTIISSSSDGLHGIIILFFSFAHPSLSEVGHRRARQGFASIIGGYNSDEKNRRPHSSKQRFVSTPDGAAGPPNESSSFQNCTRALAAAPFLSLSPRLGRGHDPARPHATISHVSAGLLVVLLDHCFLPLQPSLHFRCPASLSALHFPPRFVWPDAACGSTIMPLQTTDTDLETSLAVGLLVEGRGNCLFNALSDQIYGDQQQHAEIRARVIEYMREHAGYYKQFIDVHPGGGIRRNPKRKNAGAYSSPANFVPPSPADIDRVFESHLQTMARGGVYGDNMEISAFCSAFKTDVKIYQRDFAYMVTGGVKDENDPDEGNRPAAHIAYHQWEHYSSIRNLTGPHSGRPEVQETALSVEEEARQKEKLAQTPHVLPWQIDVVGKSLPWLADKLTIKRALQEARGDVNLAVSRLLDADEYGSASSQQESSSVERDHDSDDDMHDGPSKKQDRRMSRASRALKPRCIDSKHALSHLIVDDDGHDSYGSFDSETSSIPDGSQQSIESTEVENGSFAVRNDSQDSITLAPSSTLPPHPKIRLKLHGPKPPDHAQRIGKGQAKQQAPRITAREKKDIMKQAQKAARKERQQQASRDNRGRDESLAQAGIPLRQKSLTDTPPVETLRTLFI
nr:otu domain-containing protein 3 [Quercus suber]